MFNDILKDSIAFSDVVPSYGTHVDDRIITLDGSRMMFVIQFTGLSFNTLSQTMIERFANRVNSVLLSAGKFNSENLSVWAHVIKRRVTQENIYKFDTEFMQSFNDRYMERFSKEKFFQTRYYMSFILKYHDDVAGAVSDLNRLITAILSRTSEGFGARALGVYEKAGGSAISEIGSFLNYLASGVDADIPISAEPMVNLIDQGAVHFGYDVAQFRASNGTSKSAVFYDLRTHPATGKDGQWDFLLTTPCEFIFSQSFQFWSSNTALKVLGHQANKINSTKNSPDQLVEELETAKRYVSAGDITFGEHQGALIIFGDSLSDADESATKLAAEFSSHGDAVLRRATLSAINTYLSVFPASKHRPFKEPKTTRNLVCGFSLHNYPQGKPDKNPLGDGSAILPLSTDDGGIYFLNLQDTPLGQDSRGMPAAGHTLTLGMTEAGKTTIEATIVCYAARFGCAVFGIDYNESMINTYRGPLKGQYFRIRNGEPTGLNPFQWEDSPTLRAFLYELVGTLAGSETTAEEHAQITLAVDTVMRFEASQRRLWHVQRNIPDIGDGNNLRTRLAQWVEGGKYGWALDNPTSKYDPSTMYRVGFDATGLLVNNNKATEPVLATLFYMKDIVKAKMKGGTFITQVAEFWAPGNHPTTAAHIEGVLRAGRLQGEIIMLSTQSPESAFNCLIADAVRQQTITKIYLPNTDASWESYSDYLTRAEFETLMELSKNSRKFIIKQGSESVLASFDLTGFGEFLPVISSSTRSIAEVDELIEELGTADSDVWLTEYTKRLTESRRKREDENNA